MSFVLAGFLVFFNKNHDKTDYESTVSFFIVLLSSNKNFEGLKKEVDRKAMWFEYIKLQLKNPNEFEKQYLCYGQQSFSSNITHELKSEQ